MKNIKALLTESSVLNLAIQKKSLLKRHLRAHLISGIHGNFITVAINSLHMIYGVKQYMNTLLN